MTPNFKSYTLPQLKQLSARIAKEIAKQESAGKASMLKKLKKMAREHGLSLDEVLGGTGTTHAKVSKTASKSAPTPKAPLPVKYRHPSNKELAWSGRGRKPQWVEAWLANGGALDALATAAQKFEKKQQRKAMTLANTDIGPAEATTGSEDPAQAGVSVAAE